MKPDNSPPKELDENDWDDEVTPDYEDDEPEFIPCDKCDGHPACEDFGCAIEHGLGRMVQKENPWDW